MAFELNKTLEGDTIFVTDLPLCRVLLMNDSRFPWLILVPRKEEGAREIFDLSEFERTTVIEEVNDCAEALKEITGAYKMNIATLGNVVEQMHIHVIARFKQDEAWPKPVWGVGTKTLYEEEALSEIVKKIKATLL